LKDKSKTDINSASGALYYVSGFLFFLLMMPVFLLSCSGSDDQREFERQALSTPSGFTETDASGAVTGTVDPDDWRIAPFFQGLVEIQPAFPNPVQTTENVTIEITITGVEAVRGLDVVAWFEGGHVRSVYQDPSNPLNFGLKSVRFSALELSRFGTDGDEARGLRRVLIFDGNDNLISYGDIKVE
jgi:hypothetical protein